MHCLLPSSNGWLTWPHSLLAKISLRERVTNEAGGERIRAREQAPPLAYAFHNILLRIQELAITLPGGYNAWLITYINIMLRSIKTHTATLGHHWLIIGHRKFSLLSYNIAVYERWTFDHKTLQEYKLELKWINYRYISPVWNKRRFDYSVWKMQKQYLKISLHCESILTPKLRVLLAMRTMMIDWAFTVKFTK